MKNILNKRQHDSVIFMNEKNFTTSLGEISTVLEKIYSKDKIRWESLRFVDAFRLATHEQRTSDRPTFTDNLKFLEMEDEAFFNILYELPIAITGVPESSEYLLNDFNSFSSAKMWAYAIVPYLYEPPHKHDYFEINCIMRGECDLIFENEKRFSAKMI